MKAKRNIKVGSTVRSYDFPGNESCYIDGVVEQIKDGCAYIRITNEVWNGEVNLSGREAVSAYLGKNFFTQVYGVVAI